MEEDHLSHNNYILKFKLYNMKKIAILFITLFLSTSLMAAGSDSSSDSSKESLYDDAVKLVKRAGKLEKKDKVRQS